MSSTTFVRKLNLILSEIRKPKLRYFTNINRCLTQNTDVGDLNSISLNKFKDYTKPNNYTEEILDIYKERLKNSALRQEQEDKAVNKFGNLNLNHGIFGVFDIEDLIETLQHQQAEDIFVASVPNEIKYVDYIVVVSGRSSRHLQAIAEFVRKVFKQKSHSNEIIPKLEGQNSSDWMALDMGNIALHIFSRKARVVYDLDSLWAVGSKYDEECNKQEPVSSHLNIHTFSLKGFEPAE